MTAKVAVSWGVMLCSLNKLVYPDDDMQQDPVKCQYSFTALCGIMSQDTPATRHFCSFAHWWQYFYFRLQILLPLA